MHDVQPLGCLRLPLPQARRARRDRGRATRLERCWQGRIGAERGRLARPDVRIHHRQRSPGDGIRGRPRDAHRCFPRPAGLERRLRCLPEPAGHRAYRPPHRQPGGRHRGLLGNARSAVHQHERPGRIRRDPAVRQGRGLGGVPGRPALQDRHTRRIRPQARGLRADHQGFGPPGREGAHPGGDRIPPDRGSDPHPRVRIRCRCGDASARRGSRHPDHPGHGLAGRPAGPAVYLRPERVDDAWPGTRHRLFALHGQPLPRGAPARTDGRRGSGGDRRHERQGGRFLRRCGRDRPVGPAPVRVARAPFLRDRQRAGGRRIGVLCAHVPACHAGHARASGERPEPGRPLRSPAGPARPALEGGIGTGSPLTLGARSASRHGAAAAGADPRASHTARCRHPVPAPEARHSRRFRPATGSREPGGGSRPPGRVPPR